MLQFAAARHDDQIEFAGLLPGDITAAEHPFPSRLDVDLIQHRNDLTSQRKKGWTVDMFDRGGASPGSLLRIRRPDHIDLGHYANAADRLHRLMGRPVFTHPN